MSSSSPESNPSPEDALEALILDPDLERLEDLLSGFNLFEVLGIQRRELQHSAFLAWLLDPLGSHGLRDYFLRSFLSQAAREARERGIVDITPLDVDAWKLSYIDVATERHNVDILLVDENDGFVCLIENKIGSSEHSNQLRRYINTVEHEHAELILFPIFLTPDGTEPEDSEDAERYVPFGYGQIASLIDRVLQTRSSTISANVAEFMRQYADTLRRHVLDSSDNIDELAKHIYSKHQTAIEQIIKARDSSRYQYCEIVTTAVEEFYVQLMPDDSTKSMCRFFAPSLDDIPALKQADGWTSSDRMFLFEFACRGRVRLIAVIGPGPEEIRSRLYELARRSGKPFTQDGRKLANKWHRVYSKVILTENEAAKLGFDKAQQRIQQGIREFYEKDYWPLVNAIRTEFNLPPRL